MMKLLFSLLKSSLRIALISIWFSNLLFAVEINFPERGIVSENYLETERERVIGEMIMQRIQGSDAVIRDPIVNEYLQELAATFNRLPDLAALKLHFFGVYSPELNAFAFFGGHIAVHSGLILAVENESELAAVLAHETAHLSQRHLARMLEHHRKMLPLTFAEVLAAVAIGALGSPEAGTHLMTAAMAGHTQHLLNFTREHEQEADRIGIQFLAKTEFDPKALAEVFQRMQQQYRYQAKPPDYLLTHPLFESRIADAQNRARTLPYKQMPDSLFFQLVKARLEVAKEENVKKKLQRLKAKAFSEQGQHKITARYAYALALINALKPQEAIPILQQLTVEPPYQWIMRSSLAEAQQAAGEYPQALSTLEPLVATYPSRYPLILQYAEILLQNKEPQKTIKLLFKYRSTHSDDPAIHQLLAKAYSMAHQPIECHRSQAEWHLTRGEFKEAFIQLDLALEYAENNPKLTNIINHRKVAIKKMVERQHSIKL